MDQADLTQAIDAEVIRRAASAALLIYRSLARIAFDCKV
jgi:hypothetical protein